MSKTEELIEAAQQVDDMQDGGIVEVSNELPEDFLVKCNTDNCGHVQRRSAPGGCPNGHVSGFSYAGPLEEVVDHTEDGWPAEAVRAVEDLCDAAESAKPSTPVDDDIALQIEEATAEVCQAQQEADAAEREEDLAISAKKAASLKLEGKIEWLRDSSRRLRKLREGRFPDGEKYPLLDTKGQINAQFSKPESIAPLPPDNFDEHFRRVSVATRIESLLLPAKLVEVLADAGIHTVDDWRRKREAIEEAGAKVTTIKGLTQARLEKLIDTLGFFGEGVELAWNARQAQANVPETSPPPDAPPVGTDPAPPDGDGDPPIGVPSIPIGPSVPAMVAE